MTIRVKLLILMLRYAEYADRGTAFEKDGLFYNKLPTKKPKVRTRSKKVVEEP